MQRGRAVVAHHSGSYARALVDLFPEIGLHLSKFGSVKSKQPGMPLTCHYVSFPPFKL